jgi:hypothetical protein
MLAERENMLKLEDIEDAFIEDAKANIEGVRSVETHEKEFDDMALITLMPRAPFILVRYGGTEIIETERGAAGQSGLKKRSFHLAVGSQFLRTRKAMQRGCYDIMDSMRERYDGFNLTVGSESITLAYDGDGLLASPKQGPIVYGMILSWYEE